MHKKIINAFNIQFFSLCLILGLGLTGCAGTSEDDTGVPPDTELILTKSIERPDGKYIVSYKDFIVPEDMIIQGFEVHYEASLPASSPLNKETTTFQYSFIKEQGNVAFLGEDGSDNNYFKADYFGENIIKVIATDSSTGAQAEAIDTVFVDFATRRILGGDAENLTPEQQANIHQNSHHDLRSSTPGMAYLPADSSRGDPNSEELIKGFFKTTEARAFKTSTGALLQTTHTRRIGSNDAPPGQGVMVSRSEDHGASWHNELLLAQAAVDLWGYTGMMEIDSTIYIYMTAGHPTHQNNNPVDRGVYYFTSHDDGRTWSEKIRHDQLSDDLGYTADYIPRGTAVTTNMLEVPNLTVDGVTAPEGLGYLMHTYAFGYIWATVDGGVHWIKVADSEAYENGAANGYGAPVYLENEIAWEVLDNSVGDIYAVFRRQASTGYKREYVFSREMSSGDLGITFTELHDQSLGNLRARRAHHDMFKISSGPHAGRLMFSTPGAYSRHNPRLAITEEAIRDGGIYSGMYKEVSLYDGLAWGQSGVVYLEDGLSNTQGMGKDAIVVIGESEPMDLQTHQIIDLKPDGKGRDERYTTSLLIFSMDYYDALANFVPVIPTPDGGTGFEAFEGWEGYPLQQASTPFNKPVTTDSNGNKWSGDGHIWNQDDPNLPRNGSQVMGLGLNSAGYESVEVDVASDGVSKVSFYIKRFSSDTSPVTATLDYDTGSGWINAWEQTFNSSTLPNNYELVEVPVNQPGDVKIRFGIAGVKGLIFDDVSFIPYQTEKGSDLASNFAASQGWESGDLFLQSASEGSSRLSDHNGVQWTGAFYLLDQNTGVQTRTGGQALGLKPGTSGSSSIEIEPDNMLGIREVSFYLKRYTGAGDVNMRVDYNSGHGWINTWSQKFQNGKIADSYIQVNVPVYQSGDVKLRITADNATGLVVDDVVISSM